MEACLRNVSNLYTPESNFRARRSAYNPSARTETVTAIKDGLRYLGGPQEDGDERAKLEQLIAETQQVMQKHHRIGSINAAFIKTYVTVHILTPDQIVTHFIGQNNTPARHIQGMSYTRDTQTIIILAAP